MALGVAAHNIALDVQPDAFATITHGKRFLGHEKCLASFFLCSHIFKYDPSGYTFSHSRVLFLVYVVSYRCPRKFTIEKHIYSNSLFKCGAKKLVSPLAIHFAVIFVHDNDEDDNKNKTRTALAALFTR